MEALFRDLLTPTRSDSVSEDQEKHIWSVTIATPRSLESGAGNSPIELSRLLQLGYEFEVAWG